MEALLQEEADARSDVGASHSGAAAGVAESGGEEEDDEDDEDLFADDSGPRGGVPVGLSSDDSFAGGIGHSGSGAAGAEPDLDLFGLRSTAETKRKATAAAVGTRARAPSSGTGAAQYGGGASAGLDEDADELADIFGAMAPTSAAPADPPGVEAGDGLPSTGAKAGTGSESSLEPEVAARLEEGLSVSAMKAVLRSIGVDASQRGIAEKPEMVSLMRQLLSAEGEFSAE